MPLLDSRVEINPKVTRSVKEFYTKLKDDPEGPESYVEATEGDLWLNHQRSVKNPNDQELIEEKKRIQSRMREFADAALTFGDYDVVVRALSVAGNSPAEIKGILGQTKKVTTLNGSYIESKNESAINSGPARTAILKLENRLGRR